MLVGGDIDHVAHTLRRRDGIVALLVGEDDQTIALAVDLLDSLAEQGAGMRLAVDDGVAEREAAPRPEPSPRWRR